MSAANARSRLVVLLEERAAALCSPLRANGIYMADLEADIAASRAAFAGAVVTELACARARVHGTLRG